MRSLLRGAGAAVLVAFVLAGCSSNREPKYCNADTKTRVSALISQIAPPASSTLTHSLPPSCDDSTDSVSAERGYAPASGVVGPGVRVLSDELTATGWIAHPEKTSPAGASGSAVIAVFERAESGKSFGAKIITGSPFGEGLLLLVVGAGSP